MRKNGIGSDIITADPSKEFFIDMLTRDISLGECVLDLTDNSVHSLLRQIDLDVMRILEGKQATSEEVEATVEITFTPTKFTITDMCGGISVKDAREIVFRLGNPNPDKRHAGLGVYGIGMKRAAFKIGKMIKVESRTDTDEFSVTIDVEKWKKKTSWNLEFDYARKRSSKTIPAGTTIEITQLNQGAKRMFALQSFNTELLRRISTAYALFLEAGVAIMVNKKPAVPVLPEFAGSEDVKSGKRRFKQKGVEVLVMAGLTPRIDRKPRGWYIFCNGRMVLEANQDFTTGWGDSLPAFHTKYNHFLGYVYFKSKDVSKLPWKTTKDGVEHESPIFQKALAEMKILARPVLNFLNKMYPSEAPAEQAERETLQRASAVSVESVASKRQSRSFSARTKQRGWRPDGKHPIQTIAK